MLSNPEAYEEALKKHRYICDCFATYVESLRNGKGADTKAYDAIVESVPPGLYQHWKSDDGDPKYYAVTWAGCEQDVNTPSVSYASLYGKHAGKGTSRHLLDSERGFLMPIDREKPFRYRGPRFVLIKQLNLVEVAVLIMHHQELSAIKSPKEVEGRAFKILHPSEETFT